MGRRRVGAGQEFAPLLSVSKPQSRDVIRNGGPLGTSQPTWWGRGTIGDIAPLRQCRAPRCVDSPHDGGGGRCSVTVNSQQHGISMGADWLEGRRTCFSSIAFCFLLCHAQPSMRLMCSQTKSTSKQPSTNVRARQPRVRGLVDRGKLPVGWRQGCRGRRPASGPSGMLNCHESAFSSVVLDLEASLGAGAPGAQQGGIVTMPRTPCLLELRARSTTFRRVAEHRRRIVTSVE